jgi:hypothetical protein
VRVAKVHPWSFSNGFKPLKDLNASSIVIIAHWYASEMVWKWGTAGQNGGFCFPVPSFKRHCPPRGIKIPLWAQEKRGIARHFHPCDGASVDPLQNAGKIAPIQHRKAGKKGVVEEA